VSSAAPSVLPLGEAAWTVALGEAVDLGLHRRVTALAERIRAAELPDVLEIVAAYAAVTVFFDPLTAHADALRHRISDLATALAEVPTSSLSALPSSGRLITIPVRYDGPDLPQVSRDTGLSEIEVVRRHAEREYHVYLLGFAPGFAYLGDLDPALVLPRRPAPRPRVPAGAVAIGGAQTGVYPLATPGGWHLIGSTTLRMFDPARDPAAMLQVGDRVRFLPAE
jgi:KipI family sensor histidine kinase inhibitor